MKKQTLILRAPLLTASGYGVHSRQILRALLSSDAFDLSCMPINWGQTPFILDSEDPLIQKIYELGQKFVREQQQKVGYDVSVQVTIPNEFMKMAPINIGVTAGIEVDRVSPDWINKANQNIDLIVVPSRHAAQVYASTQYQEQGTDNIIKLQKPILVAPEGVDTQFYNTLPCEPFDRVKFDTEFNFLAVGLGFERGFSEDRKNISSLVKWFCERFKGDKRVGLILKCSMVGNSLLDFEQIKSRITEVKSATGCGEFPRIHLIHGRLSDKEMASLYKHPQVKVLVSPTHGEGFGLPMLEAAACGLPVMATDWSGHLDFLSVGQKRLFIPLAFELKTIPDSVVWKDVIEPGCHWAYPREEDVKSKLYKVSVSYDKPKEWATELAQHVQTNFSEQKTNYDFSSSLMRFLLERGQNAGRPQTEEQMVKLAREQLKLEGKKTLLYTMPMSAGDVFISTAVVDSLKKKFPDHEVIFATQERYKDILKGNPSVAKIIQFEDWMTNVPFCEKVFDLVFTPNLAIQMMTSNWVRGGKGRLLGDEMAVQCGVDFGEYSIKQDGIEGGPSASLRYIILHPGSGKGQWEARNYLHWQEVVKNLKKMTDLDIVQVGQSEDPLYQGCVDLRGKTTYNQLALVIQNAACVVGIDTVSMHMAAALGTPHVALFGSSYAGSTGPVYKKNVPHALLETRNRYTCEKACYKHQCAVDSDHPCINEISPRQVVTVTLMLLNGWTKDDALLISEKMSLYEEHRPKIGGYTHVLNAKSQGYPFEQSIRSMLGFCDSVVVVDGGSTDGTLEVLRDIERASEGKLKVYDRPWDWNEPGMDGQQKAYARAMCDVGQDGFLWQQDADEVVHEEDYEKIRKLVKRFPKDTDLLSLPVVELWGSSGKVRTDRHSWKWRLSRNNFRITHGIQKDARVFDEKTGKTYSKKGMSDGCEFIDVMTGEYIPHKSFYTQEHERLRQTDPESYGREMNKIFKELPCVFHYSWGDIPRKIRNFKQTWNKLWNGLYLGSQPEDRFPDVTLEDMNTVFKKAEELEARGGEHGPAQTFKLERSQPKSMVDAG
jgi:ADP-heptose:LPS heptosyltransferase